jgi:hypothetical protein
MWASVGMCGLRPSEHDIGAWSSAPACRVEAAAVVVGQHGGLLPRYHAGRAGGLSGDIEVLRRRHCNLTRVMCCSKAWCEGMTCARLADPKISRVRGKIRN